MKTHSPSAAVGGVEAVLLEPHAKVLYDLGGKELLEPGHQNVLRNRVEMHAREALALPGAVSSGPSFGRTLTHTGRAAGLGALVDASVAATEAGFAYHRGELTGRQAVTYVGREALTGAASAGAGAAGVALLVALTGGVAAPLAFLIGVGLSTAARHGLRQVWR